MEMFIQPSDRVHPGRRHLQRGAGGLRGVRRAGPGLGGHSGRGHAHPHPGAVPPERGQLGAGQVRFCNYQQIFTYIYTLYSCHTDFYIFIHLYVSIILISTSHSINTKFASHLKNVRWSLVSKRLRIRFTSFPIFIFYGGNVWDYYNAIMIIANNHDNIDNAVMCTER